MNVLTIAAASVGAIGTIGSATLYLDHAHVSSQDFGQHLSEQRVGTVFEYMNQIRDNGPHPWLCDALEQELYNLCTELPEHAMCKDGAMDEILDETGC